MGWQEVLTLARRAWNFATREDVQAAARELWQRLIAEKDLTYKENNANVVARALHRMSEGRAPRIALVGMTSSGKSSLVNVLFGSPIAEVRRTPDTTSCVLEVRFPSGLIIYDTPGIAGNEAFENTTRAFVGISQDPELGMVSEIPLVQRGENEPTSVPLAKLSTHVPSIDGVLFVVDASRTLTRHDALALKSFYRELVESYRGRVVVAGTHADRLEELSNTEREDMLARYRHISGGAIIPVSTVRGSGLAELVIALFQSLPEMVSLSKMQESLTNESKLGRLSFVINEASGMLAEATLLKGSEADEIQLISLCLFAMVCNHYAVDEATWMQLHGNAATLGTEAQKSGVKMETRLRDPQGFWEHVAYFFGKRYTFVTKEYERIGVGGLSSMVPGVYDLLYEFSACKAPRLSNKEIVAKISERKSEIEAAMDRVDKHALAGEIRNALTAMLPT